MNEIYLFEIIDNDYKENENNLMLYKIKNFFLTPLIDDFEKGHPKFPCFENIMHYLNEQKINTITTYFPTDLDTVCSHPYEIGDFTNEEIEFGACLHRFYHLEFSPLKEQIKILGENKINIIYLKDKEISDLEKSLKFHY